MPAYDFAMDAFTEATCGRGGREQQHRKCLCPAPNPVDEVLFVFFAAVHAGRK
jgi:hypothetical protein